MKYKVLYQTKSCITCEEHARKADIGSGIRGDWNRGSVEEEASHDVEVMGTNGFCIMLAWILGAVAVAARFIELRSTRPRPGIPIRSPKPMELDMRFS